MEATMTFTREELTGLAASLHAQIVRLTMFGSPNTEDPSAAIRTLQVLLSRVMTELAVMGVTRNLSQADDTMTT
jgi:hypothetical protein